MRRVEKKHNRILQDTSNCEMKRKEELKNVTEVEVKIRSMVSFVDKGKDCFKRMELYSFQNYTFFKNKCYTGMIKIKKVLVTLWKHICLSGRD